MVDWWDGEVETRGVRAKVQMWKGGKVGEGRDATPLASVLIRYQRLNGS